jgi:putative transposase
LCTRMVVGWQMAEHMRTSLVVDALDMARLHGHLGPGAVFHSDYAESWVKPRIRGFACSGGGR